MINKRLCKYCTHIRLPSHMDGGPRDALEFSKCGHPKAMEGNLVDGVGEPRWYCSTSRTNNWLGALITGTCGKSGRWWEPR